MRYNFFLLKTQLGRSIIEILSVLAIMSIISIGIYSMVGNVFAKRDLTNTITTIESYEDSIRQAFSWIGTYNFDNTGTGTSAAMTQLRSTISGCGSLNSFTCYLKNQNIIKNINNTGKVPLSSGVEVSFSSQDEAASTTIQTQSYITSSFTITVTGANKTYCHEFLNTNWGVNLYQWSISTSNTTTWRTNKLPLTNDYTYCDANTTYIFKLKYK